MTKATYIQTNFTSGELSPKLHSRVDIAKYANGCKTLENMIVNPQGGAFRRGGSKFIADVKTNTTKVRLISFNSYSAKVKEVWAVLDKDLGS